MSVVSAQAQGVGDDAHRTEGHGGCGDHRGQQPAEGGVEHSRGDRNADDVVDECEQQVLLDVAHSVDGQVAGLDQGCEVAAEEGHVCALDGDVGPLTPSPAIATV